MDKLPSEKILNKIKNLLTLANGTKNVHEAAVAFRKAQELLLEYNLNPEHVEGVAEELGIGEIVELPCIFPIPNLKNRICWFSWLCKDLATMNLCKMYNIKEHYRDKSDRLRKSNEVRIVGRRDDVESLIYMINNITIQLINLCERDWQEYKTSGGMLHGRMWKNTWFNGAVGEIISNVSASFSEFQRNPAANALIISRKNEIQQYIDKEGGKLRVLPGVSYRLIKSAYNKGKEAGSQTNVQKAAAGAISSTLYLE